MKLNDYIKILYQKKYVGSFPFFWILKNNNLIVTIGKTATRTLLNVDNIISSSEEDIVLNYETLLDLVYNKKLNIHIIMREPYSRFKSGLFENFITENLFNNDYKIKKKTEEFLTHTIISGNESITNCIDTEKLSVLNKYKIIEEWTNVEWVERLQNFIKTKIEELNKNESNDFHMSNWLYNVKYLKLLFGNGVVKIWRFDELKYILRFINSNDTNILTNEAECKFFVFEFLNAYNNIDFETKKIIDNYIHNEIEIWNELIKNDDTYISILDNPISHNKNQ